jgi:hypothetical protein
LARAEQEPDLRTGGVTDSRTGRKSDFRIGWIPTTWRGDWTRGPVGCGLGTDIAGARLRCCNGASCQRHAELFYLKSLYWRPASRETARALTSLKFELSPVGLRSRMRVRMRG